LSFIKHQKDDNPESLVLKLIERGRAAEQLLQTVVERRTRNLFDENNSDAKNMRLLNLLE
jgi:hypothetical protein